jgi:multiple sugar transport system permease protein
MAKSTPEAALRTERPEVERLDNRAALYLTAPFVVVFGVLFIYPTLQMVFLSFTSSQLIVPGKWVGLANYLELLHDRRFGLAVTHTAYFALLTVLPSTALGLLLAILVNRLKGPLQGVALAVFFIPYILPVATVTTIWAWMLDYQGGVLQGPIEWLTGARVHVLGTPSWLLPAVAVVTIWWGSGFNVLLCLAGLKNVPPELYEAARLDGAGRRAQFWHVTLPLVWPVVALVFTLQLILQLKLFDQLYLLSFSDRVDQSIVLVQYIYNLGFQSDRGGYASTVAVALFVIVVTVSALQLQLLRATGRK